MDAFPDADYYLARPGGSGNPVEYAARIQLTRGLVGLVSRPTRRVWAFLFINLRGLRPLWMDRTMLVFTQLGTGIADMAIGLFFLPANGWWRPSSFWGH